MRCLSIFFPRRKAGSAGQEQETLLGKIDESIGIYWDSMVPAAKQQKGCKGTYLLTDRETGYELHNHFLHGASGYIEVWSPRFKTFKRSSDCKRMATGAQTL